MGGWLAGICFLESWSVTPIFPTSTKVSDGEGIGLFPLPHFFLFFFFSLPSCSPAPSDPWALQLCVLRNRRVQLLTGLSSLSHFPSLLLCAIVKTVVLSPCFHLQASAPWENLEVCFFAPSPHDSLIFVLPLAGEMLVLKFSPIP